MRMDGTAHNPRLKALRTMPRDATPAHPGHHGMMYQLAPPGTAGEEGGGVPRVGTWVEGEFSSVRDPDMDEDDGGGDDDDARVGKRKGGKKRKRKKAKRKKKKKKTEKSALRREKQGL